MRYKTRFLRVIINVRHFGLRLYCQLLIYSPGIDKDPLSTYPWYIYKIVNFQEAVAKLKTYLELPDLLPTPQGSYPFSLDDTLEISFVPGKEESELHLWGWVADLPVKPDGVEKFLRKMLKSSLARAKLDPEYLLLDGQRNTFMLYKPLNIKLIEDHILEQNFETFVNNLELWQNIAKDSLEPSLVYYNPNFPLYP